MDVVKKGGKMKYLISEKYYFWWYKFNNITMLGVTEWIW